MTRRRRRWETFVVHVAHTLLMLATLIAIIEVGGMAIVGMLSERSFLALPGATSGVYLMVALAGIGGVLRYVFRQRARRMWHEHVCRATWGYYTNEFGESK